MMDLNDEQALSSLEPSTSTQENHDKVNNISDVVSFSLCSLCAIRLNSLYSKDNHESFKIATIEQMVKHFGLPEKIIPSIRLGFHTDDEFTFLSAIKQNHKERIFRLIEELILLSINNGSYDARMHYLIVDVAELLGIPRDLVEMHCESIYDLMLKASKEQEDANQDPESQRDREKRESRKKIKKYLIIGLASLGGGAVIGVTGGLAAPIVASAFGAAIGAGSIVMSSAAASVVGSLFGVAGAGLTASKVNKRIGDLEEFSFQSLSPENDQTSLTITIAISGWISELSEEHQFARPWRNLRHTREQYCLRYESKYLLELSQAMDYLLSFVVSYAAQEALKYTFLAGLMAAIAWPTALISMANIIDNPWDVCIGRSAEAGKHLADVLMSHQQGRRPVSLIGFSLGARVIFFCLQELAERKNSEGIICDVILLGAPVTASLNQWEPLGRVVSGRIINGYSSSDWLLKFLYRTSSAAIRVAGLQELCWKDRRVKNVNLTSVVGGHMDYYKKLTDILEFIGVRTVLRVEGDDLSATMPNCDLLVSRSDSGICTSSTTFNDLTELSGSLSQQSLTTSVIDPLSAAPSPTTTNQQLQARHPTSLASGSIDEALRASDAHPIANKSTGIMNRTDRVENSTRTNDVSEHIKLQYSVARNSRLKRRQQNNDDCQPCVDGVLDSTHLAKYRPVSMPRKRTTDLRSTRWLQQVRCRRRSRSF